MNSEITDDIKEDQGFTFTGYITGVYTDANQDVNPCLIVSKSNECQSLIDVRDQALFDSLRPYMFTKTKIKFEGIVEEETDEDDNEFYLYIVKSFEVLS